MYLVTIYILPHMHVYEKVVEKSAQLTFVWQNDHKWLDVFQFDLTQVK